MGCEESRVSLASEAQTAKERPREVSDFRQAERRASLKLQHEANREN